MCQECYTTNSRKTPLLHPKDCLTQHTQYICGTCGRCICIERDPKRGLQRWNFPFTSLEIAKLYLRTADVTMKKNCGIYELHSTKGRTSYKIFASKEDVISYLAKHSDKSCDIDPIYIREEYIEYPDTEIRRLRSDEILRYLEEQSTSI